MPGPSGGLSSRRLRVVLLAGACLLVGVSAEDKVRFCTENDRDEAACKTFIGIAPLSTPCNGAADCREYSCTRQKDCMVAVLDQEAEVTVATPLDMHYHHERALRGESEDLKLVAAEHYGKTVKRSCGLGCGSGHEYKAVAIVTTETCTANPQLTLAGTRGFSSCHAAYADTPGWIIPVAELQNQGLLSSGNDVRGIQDFYSTSCAPNDDDPRLCSSCSTPDSCTGDDAYAGHLGVLACLRAGAGQVGFTDQWTMLGSGRDGATGVANLKDFRVLCSDGCEAITNFDKPGCYLASVVADAVVARLNMNPGLTNGIRTDFEAAGTTPQFSAAFGGDANPRGALFTAEVDSLVPMNKNVGDYLGSLNDVLTRYLDRAPYDQPILTRIFGNTGDYKLWELMLTVVLCTIGGCLFGCLGHWLFLRHSRNRAAYQAGKLDEQPVYGAPQAGTGVDLHDEA